MDIHIDYESAWVNISKNNSKELIRFRANLNQKEKIAKEVIDIFKEWLSDEDRRNLSRDLQLRDDKLNKGKISQIETKE